MQSVVLDSSLMARFPLDTLFQFCDQDGHVLGYFTPATRAEDYELEDPVTEEEARQLLQEPIGRPLGNILADLERQS